MAIEIYIECIYRKKAKNRGGVMSTIKTSGK